MTLTEKLIFVQGELNMLHAIAADGNTVSLSGEVCVGLLETAMEILDGVAGTLANSTVIPRNDT